MTGIVHPISATEPRKPRRGFYVLTLLFRYSLGQSPARSLKGLDALGFLTVNHPHMAKAFPLDCPVIQQPV